MKLLRWHKFFIYHTIKLVNIRDFPFSPLLLLVTSSSTFVISILSLNLTFLFVYIITHVITFYKTSQYRRLNEIFEISQTLSCYFLFLQLSVFFKLYMVWNFNSSLYILGVLVYKLFKRIPFVTLSSWWALSPLMRDLVKISNILVKAP